MIFNLGVLKDLSMQLFQSEYINKHFIEYNICLGRQGHGGAL